MRRLVIRGAVLLMLGGCTRAGSPEPPAGDPYARGPIVTITHHATASSYLVGAMPGTGEQCGIAATADSATRYLSRVPPGELRAVERSALSEGDTVEVYVEGPLALSCPPQGRASAIVLVAEGP